MLYFRKVRGAVELLSNMDEDDVEFTLGKYFEAIAHQETTNKVADIEAVFTQVQKPPKKKRKLPSRVFKQLLDPDASKNASGNLSSSPSMSKIGNSSAINANLAASQSLNVINSDIMYKKYNELSSIMKLLERYKHEQLRYTNDPQALVIYYKELPLSESQVYKLPSDPKELEIILNRFFSRNILITRMYALYRFIYGFYSNNTRTIFDFWNSIEIEDKYRAGIYCKNSEEMLSYITSFFENQEKMKKEEEVAKVLRHEEESKRYKGKYANIKRPSLYQKNEKRLALGKNLMELSKKFPLDPVLKKMLKVEMQFNIHLKFDLEFDTANEQEENARKSRLRNLSSIKKRDLRSQDEIMRQTWEKSKFMDQQENQNKAAELRLLKAQEQEMQKVIQELVKQYLNKRQIQQIPISKQLGISYASLKTQFPLAMKKHFPYYNYGRAKKENGEFTFNKSYPLVWKHHFFSLVKSYLRTSEGLILLKSLPCNFWTPPSSSKCTVHANMDCPPNCGYVTLNKKALKQTFIEEKYVMNWHEKLRPWARPDVAEQKEKIFMSYADARECTFEPKTGSKVPKKHLDLAMQTFSELRNTIMPGEAPNFAMWVNRMGQNFRSRDPLIYKAGVFKQAKAIFLQGAPEQAKKKLIENFNIPCILDHFEPGKPRPTINEKPLEIFNNPQNLELMTNVYQLYSSIREIKIDLRRQIEKLKIEDQRETKIYMCPCKDDNCPGDVKPRLNNSDVATNIQLGKNCSLAHHTFELRFKQEEIARKKARQRAIENLSKLIQEYKPKPAWKPDGKLNDCLRCQQTFLYKPTDESKGPTKVDDYARSLGCFCNKCALEQRLKMKHASFIEKAKEKNKQFKKDPEQLAKELANCKKLGIYRKALTLFKNRRTVAAFTSISEAIKILREEREVECKVIEISKSRIIEKIGIDPSLSLTQTQELNRTVESSPNADGTSVQKIALFKAQTEKLYVGTANHFMNHQIELLYLQIEEKLMKDHQHIESLREKAEILEDLEQEGDKNEKPVGFLFKKNKVKMCVFVKEKKKCPNGKDCQDAHSAIELDLVPKQKVAENLYQTSEALENRLKNDILAEDWKP